MDKEISFFCLEQLPDVDSQLTDDPSGIFFFLRCLFSVTVAYIQLSVNRTVCLLCAACVACFLPPCAYHDQTFNSNMTVSLPKTHSVPELLTSTPLVISTFCA